MHRLQPHRRRGFSLIEMIMVIVVVSVAAVPLLGSLAQPGRALLLAENLQVATNMAQACADYIVRSHHDGVPSSSFANINNTICAFFPVPSGFSPPTVVVTDVTSLTPLPPMTACVSTSIGFCKKVDVMVAKSGTTLASVTFMITNY